MNDEVTEPTMRYRPDAVHGARKSEGRTVYYYKVFEGDDVDECLNEGWFKHWDDFPKVEIDEKKDLEVRARKHGVELDRRKNIDTLKAEVEALENPQ